MIEVDEKKVQELKELENEINDLRIDINSAGFKIVGALERIKELEAETEKARDRLNDLYANIRVLNSQLQEKNTEMKNILNVFTGNFYNQ